jgi:hypothetical protein
MNKREEVNCIKHIEIWMIVDIEYEFKVQAAWKIEKYYTIK